MTAVAQTLMPERAGDAPSTATLTPRSSICDDAPAPSHFAPPVTSPVPETPWRAPMFYLAAIAGVVLLIAVGIVLLWRVVTRSRSV
ncbi:hypothetical protein [Sphingomonas sp. PB2P12]|uniref:hypothetical protein n=1 Tax=Sphingomonas sandaracina TaxID=3096157 RepID=UPI002FCC86AE